MTYSKNSEIKRIVVAGSSGSGKTTLAKRISSEFSLTYIDIDAIHWLPNWVNRPTAERIELLESLVDRDDWVVDGFSGIFRQTLLPRMDLLIWPRVPLVKCIGRITVRTYKRSKSKELVCNGNVESIFNSFNGKDALIPFTIRTFRQRAKMLEALVNDPEIRTLVVNNADEALVHLQKLVGPAS